MNVSPFAWIPLERFFLLYFFQRDHRLRRCKPFVDESIVDLGAKDREANPQITCRVGHVARILHDASHFGWSEICIKSTDGKKIVIIIINNSQVK